MPGTVIITGANGSLAIPAIHRLLTNHPDCTLIATVRSAASTDPNTTLLHSTLSHFPSAKTSVRELDLASLSAVKTFSQTLVSEISTKKLPALNAIICNAYYWNLNSPVALTEEDGYEKTFQISHLAHVSLVLRLLGSFDPKAGGRIILFSSNATFPGKNGLEKYPPGIPSDLNELVKPTATSSETDVIGRGFQRYANAKLVVVMWMYALNRYLEKNPQTQNISALAVNPGNLSDSRALRTNTPSYLYYISLFIIRPLRPLLQYMDPTMRTSADAGADVIALAMDDKYKGERGYFTMSKKDESPEASRDEEVQGNLWEKSAEWV
ncbi:MAG: hypothetical protein Q9168_008282, partial [Polycauliona sp. 1 TL-2023]